MESEKDIVHKCRIRTIQMILKLFSFTCPNLKGWPVEADVACDILPR
jgi:hypothetical protein